MEDGKDRISELPEDIRKRILSFLSTRDAIVTSALARAWRYSWLSLPCLDLGRDFFLKRWIFGDTFLYRLVCDHAPDLEWSSPFLEFLDRAVVRKGRRIEKLRLYIPPIPPLSSRVASLLSGLNVGELEVEVVGDKDVTYCRLPYFVPPCVFTMASITKLLIQGCDLSGSPIGDIDLPSLRELSLSDAVANDLVVENLLGSSAALEKVCISDCKGFLSLRVSGHPKLVCLKHEGNEHLGSVEINAPNLESLSHLPSRNASCKLVLSASCEALTHLELSGRTDGYISALERMSLWGSSLRSLSISGGWVRDILGVHAFQNLSDLKLENCEIAKGWLSRHLCLLAGLRALEVAFCKGSGSIEISSGCLESLTIRCERELEHVDIDCPSLLEFSFWTTGKIISLSPGTMSAPPCANLYLQTSRTGGDWDVQLIELLKGLRQFKCLSIETALMENVIIPRRLRQQHPSPVCRFEEVSVSTHGRISSLDVTRCIDAFLWVCPRLKFLEIVDGLDPRTACQYSQSSVLLKFKYKEPRGVDEEEEACGCYTTLPVPCWRHSLKGFRILEEELEDDDGAVRRFLEAALIGK